MDMVARRQIKLGEAITIDYATFAVDFLPFDCLCGHACCRKRILPTDCLLPAISDTFGDHMSAYVHKRILQHKAQQAAAATRKSLEGGVPIGGRDNSPHQQPANGATVTS